MSAGTGPGSRPAGTGGRWPLIIGCFTAVMLLVLAATVGGITYLVLDRRADEASRATFDGGRFTFEYPVEWTEPEGTGGNPHPDQVVELRNADLSQYVTVLDKQGTMTADEECAQNAVLIDSQGLGTEQNEVVGEREVDGRPAIHHRARASDLTSEHPVSVIDTWCIQKPDGVILFVAQTQGPGPDLEPMPEGEQILDSWTWVSDADD